MEIWTETFSAHEVSRAAVVPPETLQNWFKREVIVGHKPEHIEGGGIKGRHRRFSFHAVMQISIAAALLEASGGMDIKQAFSSAGDFAHSGHGATGARTIDDGTLSEDHRFPRVPAHPYHSRHGRTLLATVSGKTAIVLDDGKGDAFGCMSTQLRRANGFTVIDAGSVFDQVCTALGEHPRVVLDAAYPEAMAV